MRTQNAIKMFDYTAMTDRLRTVSLSKYIFPTGVIYQVSLDRTFQLNALVNTFKIQMYTFKTSTWSFASICINVCNTKRIAVFNFVCDYVCAYKIMVKWWILCKRCCQLIVHIQYYFSVGVGAFAIGLFKSDLFLFLLLIMKFSRMSCVSTTCI